MSRNKKKTSSKAASRTSSPVFRGEDHDVNETGKQEDIVLKDMKVSDILKGNYAPIKIPLLDIPGMRPLIY